MPQAILGVIGGAGGAAAVSTAVTVAVYGVSLVVTLAMSASQKRKEERKMRASNDASITDRLVNVQNPVTKRTLVLGRARVGGGIFFNTSVAPHNAVYVVCMALAGHEIDGVERIFFNETPIDLDADGNVTTAPWGHWDKITVKDTSYSPTRTLEHPPIEGTIRVIPVAQWGTPDYFFPQGATSAPYTIAGNVLTITDPLPDTAYLVTYQWERFLSTARVFVHLGSPDQASDPRMQLLLPGMWTAEHRARGVAYLECEFVYEETSFPTGIPNVTALIRGAKCYDPRTGLTTFTENPALHSRHVLTHPQFGKRTSLTADEEASIIAAANANEANASYTGTDLVQKYRSALVAPFGTPPDAVLDDLAQAMGGSWAYAGAEYVVRSGVYQAPVMHLTDADLAVLQRSSDGSVSQTPIGVSPHRPRNDKVNSIAPRIWDQAANYIETPLAPIRSDALVAADGQELSQEVPMPAVFYAGQANHIAGILMRDGRDPLTATLPFKMRAYPLELFDGVTLTLARYGWVNKEFLIVNRTFHPEGYVMLTLKETSAAIYAQGAPFVPAGSAPNTGLPKPWEIYPPTINGIFSGESELIVQSDGTVLTSVRVTWLPIQEASIASGGSVEVQFQVLPDGDWRTVVVPGDSTEARLTGVDDGAVVAIRARTRNALASSAWSQQQLHQVIGKTEPPPNIENLSISGSVLSWSLPRRVPDLAGYVFRFHYGNNLDWYSAAPLHTGLITESPYDLVTRPGGVVTIMGKAQDTTGNQSLVTGNIVMNLGDPPIANILEQWDFDALGWPFDASESSGWTIVSGDPSADALDSFYGTDDQSFFGGETEPFYEAGAYGQMVYVSPVVTINSALAGSIMTLVAQAQGTDLRIDYRLSGPGSFYGPDTASFYDADTVAFDPDLGIIVVTSGPLYGPPGDWMPWPGQVVAASDSYQFRVTIGAGPERGILQGLVLTVDAPDMEEVLANVVISAAGTPIPYTKPFTSIKAITATLQANVSGAVTIEITKTPNLAPVIHAYNAAHTAVSGASADIVIKGY